MGVLLKVCILDGTERLDSFRKAATPPALSGIIGSR